MAKRYYWLKLPATFFDSLEIKRLRKLAGGDTFTIIYLKMMLLSLENEGKLYYQGICSNFAEELALQIDEDIDNVQVTISFLEKVGLIENNEEDEGQQLTQVAELTGSEADSARRVRKHRERKKLQSNGNALQSNIDVTDSNTEIEIDKDIELEKELEKELEIDIQIDNRRDFRKIYKKLTDTLIDTESYEKIKTISIVKLNKLLQEIEKSKYLQSNLKIDFAIKNIDIILSGKYRDFKTGRKNKNKFNNFESTLQEYDLEAIAKRKREEFFKEIGD